MPGRKGARSRDPFAYARASQGIANLRGAFLLILISFHACLAYLGSTAGPATSFDEPPYPWLAFPIVDQRRFYGFDIYCAWFDANVMAMMFLVSGLFVAPSLKRKGAARFCADRLTRLGPPFLFSVLALTPIAIFPVFHRLRPGAGLAEYLAAYRALPFLPNGPAWFLWLLLAVSLGAAALHALAPGALDALARWAAGARQRPQRFLLTLAVAAALAYLPLALLFGPFDWFERGPISFECSRPLFYGVYFFAGVAIGAAGLGDGLLAPEGALARHWRRLALLSPLMLFAWMGLMGASLSFPAFAPLPMRALSALAYVGASVAGVMLMLALAMRFGARRIARLEPLSANALGVYVVHYAPLVWMQYLLTDAPWPAVAKWAIVCALVAPVSLALAIAMRRLGVLARLIGEDPARRPGQTSQAQP
jgi:hypothetical protein